MSDAASCIALKELPDSLQFTVYYDLATLRT